MKFHSMAVLALSVLAGHASAQEKWVIGQSAPLSGGNTRAVTTGAHQIALGNRSTSGTMVATITGDAPLASKTADALVARRNRFAYFGQLNPFKGIRVLVDAVTREGFNIAHEVSSYSLAALAKGAQSLMKGRNGALLTLSYLGAVRSMPNYNVMGVAKAALESSVRYLASDLGARKIRVNSINPGGTDTEGARALGEALKTNQTLAYLE